MHAAEEAAEAAAQAAATAPAAAPAAASVSEEKKKLEPEYSKLFGFCDLFCTCV